MIGEKVMKENYIEKIKKMGKIATVIVNIARVFVIIGMVGVIIAAVVFAVLPKDLCKVNVSGAAEVEVDLSKFGVKLDDTDRDEITKDFTDSMDFEINNVDYVGTDVKVDEDSITINASADKYTIYVKNLWILMLVVFLSMALTLVTLIFAGKVSKAFRDCENPFEMNVINSMQKLAYSLIPWALVGSFSDSLAQSIFTNNIDIVLGVNMETVFVILIIICLTYVFKYGAMLQQESDETL